MDMGVGRSHAAHSIPPQPCGRGAQMQARRKRAVLLSSVPCEAPNPCCSTQCAQDLGMGLVLGQGGSPQDLPGRYVLGTGPSVALSVLSALLCHQPLGLWTRYSLPPYCPGLCSSVALPAALQ